MKKTNFDRPKITIAEAAELFRQVCEHSIKPLPPDKKAPVRMSDLSDSKKGVHKK